jgi:acetyltransferase-like isoleucine patch superfamily enzyme
VVVADISGVTSDGAPPPAVGRFVRAVRRAYDALRQDMRRRWDRDLPFEELLFDRWERARSLGFGDGASIYHSSLVYGDVRVGEHTWIGPYTLLDGTHRLTIGSYCSISAGVSIYTHDTVQWALSRGQAARDGAPVSIGDCTYVGAQSVIARGVAIGDHVVVGACSFVNRDIPPWSVAAGVPCRRIGRVEEQNGRFTLVYDTDREGPPGANRETSSS